MIEDRESESVIKDERENNLIPAAQYVRMSTEHQRYSTENQCEVIGEYAKKHGMSIVRTYADEGKSGLRLEGRDALKQLIEDVENKKAGFDVILVYDISRWGRFQDADESAYYEYLCKRSGINVRYCAEQFENDGSPVSTIVKGVKRAMAGEYSRELSAKVFKGQCKLIELGFRQGGPAGYGLRRMLVDHNGNPKGILSKGEYKSLQTDRVILIPGPPEEVETVRWIYETFLHQGKSEKEIAEMLNRKGRKIDSNRPWSHGTVHQVLTNEKYIGNSVYNRTSFKLKKKRVRNPMEMWIRADGAFEAIVNPQQFYTAQGVIMERNRHFSDQEMLDLLKKLLNNQGKLSGFMIDETEGMPSSSGYRARFGSLIRAYRLVGYTPERDYQYLEINRILRKMHSRVVAEVIMKIKEMGSIIEQDQPTDLLTINGEFTTSLVIARCRRTQAGSLRWFVRLDTGLEPDITVVLRMDPPNENTLDYYLLPLIDMTVERLRLAEENGAILDSYRFDTLDFFFGMAERVRIKVAA
jgi:DNA invertase Pin-like site-specific DNA recombinase